MSSAILTVEQSNWRTKALLAAQCLSVLWSFVIPLSNTFTVIGSLGMLFLTLAYMDRDKYIAVGKHPVTLVILCWLILTFIDCTYSIGTTRDINTAIRKTSRLLYFPLIICIFTQAKWRLYAVLGFLASVLVSITVALIYQGRYYGGSVFKDPIFTSLFVCLSIFTVAHLAIEYPRYKYWALAFGIYATFYLLFIGTGRTGQVLFFMLYVMFCWQRVPKFKHIVVAAVIMLGLLGLIFYAPSSFLARQSVAAEELLEYRRRNHMDLPHTSSLGMRLIFAQNSWELIKMKPIFGWGSGAFRESYLRYAPESKVRKVVRANPHNQYLLTWVELGIPGLICLLALFGTLAWQFLRTRNLSGYLGLGFIVAIAVGCTINSWLLDFSSMFYFILFASVFAAGVWKHGQQE